jgi:hypothetical protein
MTTNPPIGSYSIHFMFHTQSSKVLRPKLIVNTTNSSKIPSYLKNKAKKHTQRQDVKIMEENSNYFLEYSIIIISVMIMILWLTILRYIFL